MHGFRTIVGIHWARSKAAASSASDEQRSEDGKRLYVANGLSDTVSVVDLTTLRVVQRCAAGSRPRGVELIY